MKVLSLLQVKTAEKTAVDNGLFSYTGMMKKAGKSAFKTIISRYNVIGKKIIVIAGSGNNGGDGLVIASLLKRYGAFVSLLMPLGTPSSDTASAVFSIANDIPVCESLSGDYDFYIDALFGIGFNRLFTTDIESLINKINARAGIKIAIDLPSGLYCDGGMAQTAFRADITITFIGYKQCQLLPPTSSFCGEIVLDALGIDIDNNYSYKIITAPHTQKADKNSHKGTFGTALLVCGSYGMCGAGILAARAACVSGAGIVKCVVCDKNYSPFTSAVPEAVTIPVETSAGGAPIIYDKTMLSAISGASSLLIGCGIGRSDEAKLAVKKLLSFSNIPTVLDADGINAVAGDISILRNAKTPLILTPHAGEMARLLKTTPQDVESNRVTYAKRFACDNRSVLVLKGANTIVATPDGEIYFNMTGNWGMAKGGSGDVLSGIIVALLAMAYDTISAAKTAVFVHGKAGDMAASRYTERTMIASDIIKELKHIRF